MTMCLEDIQLETGLIKNIFDYEYHKFGMLTQPSWIRHLWQHCDKYDIELKGQYSTPTLLRENDFCLMEKLCNSDAFTNQQKQCINRCRIFLQVITSADITDSDGKCVTKDVFNGIVDESRRSMYVWPNQVRPLLKDWRLWRSAIENIWCETGANRLRRALGDWIHTSHQQFNWQI